jgi:integrase/recombinase XerC
MALVRPITSASLPKTENVDISETAKQQLAAFAESLHARGSPQTVRRYIGACELLWPLLQSKTLLDLTARDIQSALSKLHANGMQPRSISTTLSAWRAWFRYLSKDDPRYGLELFTGIRTPRAPKRLPNALTEDDARQLLDLSLQNHSVDAATKGVNPEHLIRDQAMFELLYGCGIRVGELVSLDVGDVELAAGEIRVRGKGRKERVLPLGGAALRATQAWLAARHVTALSTLREEAAALFLGARGGRIHATVVRDVLRTRAVAQGIETHVHPHRLRHSFASHMLQASGDLRAVQELMGHASIASTQVYTHLDFRHLAKVYDAAHPRARGDKKKP